MHQRARINVLFASPLDMCITQRSARCAIPSRASTVSLRRKCSGSGWWCGKIRVLLKNPLNTTSRPVASVVHAANRSGDTIPNKFLNSKTSHRSRPRIAIDDPSRATG